MKMNPKEMADHYYTVSRTNLEKALRVFLTFVVLNFICAICAIIFRSSIFFVVSFIVLWALVGAKVASSFFHLKDVKNKFIRTQGMIATLRDLDEKINK